MSYEQDFIQKIVEGALFAAGEPLSVDRLLGLFEEHEIPDKNEIKEALQAIQAQCEGHAYNLVEVASGWRFQVREDLATWVNRLWEEKPQKYSRALLETLALIAYRQPITRGDIEEVRGVAVSSHIIKTLTEREWVKVVGHRDVPGRPALYATTRQFLDYFNLKSLDELPTLGELKDIDSLNGDLEFGEADSEPSGNDEGTPEADNTSADATEEASGLNADSDSELDEKAGSESDESFENDNPESDAGSESGDSSESGKSSEPGESPESGDSANEGDSDAENESPDEEESNLHG